MFPFYFEAKPKTLNKIQVFIKFLDKFYKQTFGYVGNKLLPTYPITNPCATKQLLLYLPSKKLAPVYHDINGDTFWLLPERAVYWEQQNSLIIADLHLGKTGHFRKSGIAVPQAVYKEDLQRLFALIQYHKPEQLIIVGDMFHSRENKEMDFFTRWRNDLFQLNIELVKGNHDILHNDWYSQNSIKLNSSRLRVGSFSFVHDPAEAAISETEEMLYCFSGHVHPGIRISSGSRQSLSFPCFHFSGGGAVLPAFSQFTGYVIIKPKKQDADYAIVNKTLIKL